LTHALPKPVSSQLLLFAEPLLRDGLTRLLTAQAGLYTVAERPEQLQGLPQLVIWQASSGDLKGGRLAEELLRLQERWQPAPLLLLLPPAHDLGGDALLQLPAAGILESPDPQELLAALATLLTGGRVLAAAAGSASPSPAARPAASPALGLGQWLLISGLQQIDADLAAIKRLLTPPPTNLVQLLVLQGRLRELSAARELLLLLWGPLSVAWGAPDPCPSSPEPVLAITLQQRSADGIWRAIRQRLEAGSGAELSNQSGQLLALEGLSPERRRDLLLALLSQVDSLRQRLLADPAPLQERWEQWQPELRQQAMRSLVNSYVQLPCEGSLLPVADSLLRSSDLTGRDPDLPEAQPMLASLVRAQPLLVDGQLLAADEPRAVLYLELLVSNWLVRSAELVSAELLASCASWPELRRYLLQPELLATRNLERLRNQLNAQLRWSSWVERPISLYESRRRLYCLRDGAIRCQELTEPRDAELRQLGWLQQLVTLALESRDALAPQVQGLLRGLGDLVVVLLTRVLGRAIGLVGRGIAQGMGRGIAKGVGRS
jgi:DNA-binding NarL/FixJ family response regulator